MRVLKNWLWKKTTKWLTVNRHESEVAPSDFERLRYEIRPCDILLVEGRSRVSDIIKNITLSHWTHAAIYIGRLHDIDDPEIRELVKAHYPADPDEQLLIEALLGQGTIITPLSDYRHDNLRICRPNGISRKDAQQVISYCANKLGVDYDIRQLLDLARFLFPYGVLPRKWRSSLFNQNAGEATKTVCSTMLAEAFASIHFPILPVIKKNKDGGLRLFRRNFRLMTPREFDYSPYFDIIKYPVFGNSERELYRQLPWDKNGRILNDELEKPPLSFDDADNENESSVADDNEDAAQDNGNKDDENSEKSKISTVHKTASLSAMAYLTLQAKEILDNFKF